MAGPLDPHLNILQKNLHRPTDGLWQVHVDPT